MSEPTLTESDLWQFTGTEHWYRRACAQCLLHGQREIPRRSCRGLLAARHHRHCPGVHDHRRH
jgi:hypothetical protein